MGGVTSVVRDVHELTDPRSLPNLELWLDARYPNGIGSAMPFDGDPLSTWTDLSGKGRHLTQSNSAKRPMWMKSNKNMLVNASNQLTSGWSSNLGTYQLSERTSEVARTGNYSRKSTLLAAGEGRTDVLSMYAVGMESGARLPLKPNTKYTLSVYLMPGQTGYEGYCSFVTYRADNSAVFFPPGPILQLPVGVWTRVSATFTTSADTVSGFPMVMVRAVGGAPATVGHFAYADDAMLTEGETLHPYVPAFGLPNNQPVVHFDGVDDILSTADLSLPGNAWSFYVAFRYLSNTNQRILSTNNNVGHRAMAMVAGNTFYSYGPWASSPGRPVVAETWNLGNARFWVESDPLAEAIVNGGPPARYTATGETRYGSVGSIAPTPINVGGDPTGLHLNGSVASAMIFSTLHDDITRKKIERMISRNLGIVVG